MMIFLSIPSKELLTALHNELETKYGIKLHKRVFYGFRVETGYYPVTVVTPNNVRSVAWRIARDRDPQVVEIFRNNSCQWQLQRVNNK